MIDEQQSSRAGPEFDSRPSVPALPLPAAGGDDSDAALWPTPAHSIASYESFLRDLPELMASSPGQCAAYQDGIRVGIGPRRREFFKLMYDRGYDPLRLLFFTIEPQLPNEIELLTPDLASIESDLQ